MRKRLQNLSRLLMKNFNDLFIRGQYCKVKEDYGKTMQVPRINFEKNAVDRLESLSSNPKKLWSFVMSIGGGHLNEINPLLGETWVNHFSALSQSDPPQVYGDVPHVNNINNSVNAL